VPGALFRGVPILLKMTVIVYSSSTSVRHGAIQQAGDLSANTSARHVSVLGHGHLGVPEMAGTEDAG